MGQNKNIFERNISETRFEGKISSASFSGSLTASSAKKNSDYEMLSNKPHINGVELVGDKSFSELGFPEMTEYAKLTDIPSMLPANGGDADTVNGHTVNSDIPENAVFTDTTHSDISAEGCVLQLGGLQGNVPFSITVSGKNLVYYDIEKIKNVHTAGKWDKNVYTISDVVVTFGTDGIITMSGTAAAKIAIALNWNTNNTMIELAAGSYTISGCPKQNGLSLKLVSSDGSEVYTCQETCTIDVRGGKYKFYINVEKNTVLESVNICAQLELGATATDYELPIVGRELTLTVNGTEYKITPNSNPYAVPNDIRQQDGLNVVSVSDGTLSVTGVRKNLALKRIWDKIDEITTAVIVANGEN